MVVFKSTVLKIQILKLTKVESRLLFEIIIVIFVFQSQNEKKVFVF